MKIIVEGKHGVRVTVLADSMSRAGIRFLSFEVEYPRLILAELNTHRGLSKNSASSRAIPFGKMLSQLKGRPVRFGQANPGMQDKGEDYDAEVAAYDQDIPVEVEPELAWKLAKAHAVTAAEGFFHAGYHKQVYNRLTEPFQMMKTVLSGTEFANFFWLRDDKAADPTLAELARCMKEAAAKSISTVLKAGEWHLPYMDWAYLGSDNVQTFYLKNGEGEPVTYLKLEDAIKVSCARCAAVSYRNEGYGLEKSLELYERLVGDEKKHASALEHCATPMNETGVQGVYKQYLSNAVFNPFTWQEGISHVDRKGQLWSGNLRGWIQYRKLIPGENKEGGV